MENTHTITLSPRQLDILKECIAMRLGQDNGAPLNPSNIELGNIGDMLWGSMGVRPITPTPEPDSLVKREKEVIIHALNQLEADIKDWPEDEFYNLDDVSPLIKKLKAQI